MTSPVLNEFLSFEMDSQIRADLLEAVETLTAGRRESTYNTFNVRLDADASEATVDDVLEAGRSTTVPLMTFGSLIRSWSDPRGRCN